MALRFEGFEVESAATGADAIAAVAARRPRLLVLDVMLPDIDGFEVASSVMSANSHASGNEPAAVPRAAMNAAIPTKSVSMMNTSTTKTGDRCPAPTGTKTGVLGAGSVRVTVNVVPAASV